MPGHHHFADVRGADQQLTHGRLVDQRPGGRTHKPARDCIERIAAPFTQSNPLRARKVPADGSADPEIHATDCSAIYIERLGIEVHRQAHCVQAVEQHRAEGGDTGETTDQQSVDQPARADDGLGITDPPQRRGDAERDPDQKADPQRRRHTHAGHRGPDFRHQHDEGYTRA